MYFLKNNNNLSDVSTIRKKKNKLLFDTKIKLMSL